MRDEPCFVIVGASLAGAKAAETLRAEGFEGRVVLVGEEEARPYERPPLSKDYLRGEAGRDKVYVHDASFYDAHEIELRLGTSASALDLDGREVVLSGDERLGFDALLLATGAAPRRLPVPGADLPGIHYLRDLADADALREAIRAAERVVVVGAGWIGCEVAASARQMGAPVTMLDVAALPLERVLGPELGRFYRDLHASHGVDLRLSTGVEEVVGTRHAEGVRLSGGDVVRGDVVVVGVGVAPRTELARSAGLAVDNGILTDEHLATAATGVFAAGDVANAWHPVLDRRVRLEHWSSALHQGPAAALGMLGRHAPYTRLPYFFSDQYDVGMEYSGLARDWDEVLVRGEMSDGAFIAFYLKDGRVAAGMNVNVWDVADDIAALVASGQPVARDALADPSVELASLVQATSP
ncbi:MAG TPA: FAD-dependent oxidoreductase [Acidimicrobiales bacterium]|nr:FAD-dependent oxidoreductase [Acidimicrobiales bacterium]